MVKPVTMNIHSSNSGSSVGSGHVPGSGSKIMNIMDLDQPQADRWAGGQKLHIVSSQVEHPLTATRDTCSQQDMQGAL